MRILFLLTFLLPSSLYAMDFILGANVSKKEIVQFEPVVLKVWLENVSGKPKEIIGSFDLSDGYLKVFVSDSEGKRHQIKSTGFINETREKMTLPHQGTVHNQIVLTPYPGSWMDKPGEYQLWATFTADDGGEPSGSTAVSITVKPAEGVNKEALERFRGFPQARFLAGGTSCPAIADEFTVVLLEHPDSVYVPWCYYVLGRAFQSREGDAKSNATIARQHYGSLLKKYPKFPLKAELEYEMNRELLRLGKTDEALYEINKLIKFDPYNDPNSDLFLFYEVRRVLSTVGDGNQKSITYHELPHH